MGPIVKTTSPETRIPIDLQRKREASRHTAATIPVQALENNASRTSHPNHGTLPRSFRALPPVFREFSPTSISTDLRPGVQKRFLFSPNKSFFNPGAKRFVGPEQIVFKPGSQNDLFGSNKSLLAPGAKTICLARTNRF